MRTEKQAAYSSKTSQPLQQYRPTAALSLSNERFEGESTTGSSYTLLPASA